MYDKRTGMTHEQARVWLATPENEGHCDECPERMEHPGHDCLPCGQQNCWVYMTCKGMYND